MVLTVQRNYKDYQGRAKVMEEGDYIPVATVSPPE